MDHRINNGSGSPFGVREIGRGVMELLFPRICRICRRYLADGEHALCEYCIRSRFEWSSLRFAGVRQPVLPWYLLFRVALWTLGQSGRLRRLLHRLKYGGDRAIGLDFGRELGRLVSREAASAGVELRFEPILVPVPLHDSRRYKRGYNQAEVICEGVSMATGWSVLPPGRLVRRRDTRSQTGFGPESRRKNLEEAFVQRGLELVPEELPVIVDDVYTTGATVSAVARELREAGAQQVAVATVADV